MVEAGGKDGGRDRKWSVIKMEHNKRERETEREERR